jgi:hypothetical protein
MKEALVILAVIFVLLGLTAYRYRRQIATGIQVWRMLKGIKANTKRSIDDREEAPPVSSGKLIRCSKCGTWVAERSAIKLSRGVNFCSSACVESGTKTTV